MFTLGQPIMISMWIMAWFAVEILYEYNSFSQICTMNISNYSNLTPPDPPDEHPCLETLKKMQINDQKELLLRPGDRIWFKSAIFGDRYQNGMIIEIPPGPGRNIRLDILESPTRYTSIQKYELKDGEKVNTLPPVGRIMMRWWTLQPGKYDQGICPFNRLGSNFLKVAKEAAMEVGGRGEKYLHKLKHRKAKFLFSTEKKKKRSL